PRRGCALPAGRQPALRSETRQGRLKLRRKGRLDLNRVAGHRVRKGEAPRVQELAFQLLVRDPVNRVADDGQPDRGQMHADLVRPARLEANVEERVLIEQTLDLEVGDRLPRGIGVERLAGWVVPVAPDRRLDA